MTHRPRHNSQVEVRRQALLSALRKPAKVSYAQFGLDPAKGRPISVRVSTPTDILFLNR